ncbi:MAG TPA: carbamoyltransferase C-terminal domain-containing protein, partial [Gammaproteobacteria bacterium]|nr:carbamoyltransferase C-terminal domain-containing protein [Gammaproteobacteria bacterium]
AALFGEPARTENEPITQKHMDLAASVQAALEDAVLRLTRSLRKEYNISNLCLAGGVALNCVANGKILRERIFDNMWIQPAAGDAGGALGAALAATYDHLRLPREVESTNTLDAMQGSYLGPSYTETDIVQRLQKVGAKFTQLTQEVMLRTTAEHLANNLVVGWVQGRMEFGPRALGSRSILGNPCSTTMQKNLNLKIKYRESFRPFAPAVLYENAHDWFDLTTVSPYMLLVADVAEKTKTNTSGADSDLFGIDKLNEIRSTIPAVTHVDYSARVQTVHAETNATFYNLIKNFKNITGCPVLINTSFNIRGEPIVCTPEDAFRCFMGTEMDVLVVGNCVLRKEEQDQDLAQDYRNNFKLD